MGAQKAKEEHKSLREEDSRREESPGSLAKKHFHSIWSYHSTGPSWQEAKSHHQLSWYLCPPLPSPEAPLQKPQGHSRHSFQGSKKQERVLPCSAALSQPWATPALSLQNPIKTSDLSLWPWSIKTNFSGVSFWISSMLNTFQTIKLPVKKKNKQQQKPNNPKELVSEGFCFGQEKH